MSHDLHAFPAVSTLEAKALQRDLATRVERFTRLDEVQVIAGVDCAAPRIAATIRAAVVMLRWPDLTVIEGRTAEAPEELPYIPGLLSFRELPAVLRAWDLLSAAPQLVMVDGQGIAHPRRLGIASHLGVALQVPTIGVAKSVLVGEPRQLQPGPGPGDRLDLVDRDEVVAAKVRTKARAAPLIISTGHRVGLEDAVAWVLRCCRGYRLPEPTRQAHLVAGRRAGG